MNELLKAYNMGVEAFKVGSFDNPYKNDTLPSKEWQRGWNTAYWGNYWTQRIAAHVVVVGPRHYPDYSLG